jgi:hypothetical protein
MRTTIALLASLTAAAALAGCSHEDSAEPVTTAETATAVTSSTPESVRLQIYEGGISQCVAGKLKDLAAKYHVAATKKAVVEAVARSLVKSYDAAPDALVDARAGCKQGFKLEP